MRIIVTIGLTLASLVVSGAALAAARGPDARSGFISSCEKQMYMSAAACGCMADKAEVQLDAEGIAYLSLDALDVVHSAAMSKKMTPSQMNKIDAFMRTAPNQCKGAK